MDRPDFTVIPIPTALQRLSAWIAPHVPPKLIHRHEKVSDADLIALAVLRILHKAPYFSTWWSFVRVNFFPHLPSLTQACIRLARLAPVVERIAVQVEHLPFIVVDSMPLPVCRSKRAGRCKVRGARFGYSSQGSVYGFKLHAWTKLNGQIALYGVRPANLHDLTVGHELNTHWVEYGAPKQIGDKAYQDGVYLTPPKKSAKSPDPRWKEEYGWARKMVETTFSSLVRAGIRIAPIRSERALRLRVALAVFAHNLAFFNP